MNEKTNERLSDASVVYIILSIAAAVMIVIGFLVQNAMYRSELKLMQEDLDDMVRLEETALLDVLESNHVVGKTHRMGTLIPTKLGAEKILKSMEDGYFLLCATAQAKKEFERKASYQIGMTLTDGTQKYIYEVRDDMIAYTAGDAPTVYYRTTHTSEFAQKLKSWE